MNWLHSWIVFCWTFSLVIWCVFKIFFSFNYDLDHITMNVFSFQSVLFCLFLNIIRTTSSHSWKQKSIASKWHPNDLKFRITNIFVNFLGFNNTDKKVNNKFFRRTTHYRNPPHRQAAHQTYTKLKNCLVYFQLTIFNCSIVLEIPLKIYNDKSNIYTF